MTQAYPLQWPAGRKRNRNPKNSQFKTSLTVASVALYDELKRLRASNVILSSNMEYRNDGLPYARQSNLDDTGVAVYFTYKDNQMCFACDQYYELKDNVQAIRKTIEAIRGIKRWGSSDMMAQAFKGFEALPAPADHWQILGITKTTDIDHIKRAFRNRVKIDHPDKDGNAVDFQRLIKAKDAALLEAKQ